MTVGSRADVGGAGRDAGVVPMAAGAGTAAYACPMNLEFILVAIAAALALLPLVIQFRGRWSSLPGVLFVALWLLVSIATPWLGLRLAGSPEPVVVLTNRPIERSGPNEPYVSSKTCRACHAEQYATWRGSYHSRMTQVADAGTVIPDFDTLSFSYRGERYRLERRGDEIWAEMGDPAWTGPDATRPRVERQVVIVTGSHHAQVFWVPTGHTRKLSLFPFCYRLDEQRWMPLDAAFLMPPDDAQRIGIGRWNVVCQKCHTTGAQPRIRGEDDMDTHVAEFGIACEACHGPASEHIRVNRSPIRRYGRHLAGDPDGTIANPDRLPPGRAAQVCGQCHSFSMVRQEHRKDWMEEGFSYRPGGDLEQTRVVVTPEQSATPEVSAALLTRPDYLENLFWSDGMIRVTGREYNGLINTPCYDHDDESRQLTCLSCHRLHKAADDPRSLEAWADDQLGAGMRTNEACTQCHERFRDETTLVEHTFHEPGSSGSSCYNCHMSYTTYGLLKAVRSHTIDSPTVQASVQTGRPNACNQCHMDKTLDWTAELLLERYGIPEPELSPDQRSIAASALWALGGDAGQRALMAWSMGWEPARLASGSDWMPPYLAQLMVDPYHAVRLIAHRSLRRHAGFEAFEYDSMAPAAERRDAADRVIRSWARRFASEASTAPPDVLIEPGGRLKRDTLGRLVSERDNRPVFLNE